MYESRGGANDAQCPIFVNSSGTIKLFKTSTLTNNRLTSLPESFTNLQVNDIKLNGNPPELYQWIVDNDFIRRDKKPLAHWWILC